MNDAAIVDVNPDATYVGGHVYSDSILVQADLVHRGMTYDVEVDTARCEAIECAKVIAARL